MATLKKLTRMGADVRQIARLLQAKAPEGHMLAYITPEEADLLKSRGGSGKEHEDTGVPSFEVGDFVEDFGGYDTTGYENVKPDAQITQPLISGQVTTRPPVGGIETTSRPYIREPDVDLGYQTGTTSSETPINLSQASPAYATAQQAPYVPYDMSFGTRVDVPGERLPSAMTMGAGETQAIDTAREPTLSERLQSYYKDMKPETLQRLGLAGGLGLLSAYQSNKAQKEAEKAKKEQQALGAPYQQKGAELQRAAQAGELTPAGQQQLQAVQAQAAQQASARGGAVGAAQTQAQIEALRSQLLQQQYDYGLKLSGIGDQVALGAIKTGLEADRYVQSLNSNFYTNMMYMLGGMQPPGQAQQRTT